MLPHLLLRVSGTLHGTAQTWSCSFRFRSASGDDPGGIADIQTKLETWRDALKAGVGGVLFDAPLLALMGGATRVTTLRCAAVAATGKETAVAIVEGPALFIGNGATSMPQQVACAFSLDTGAPGASNRGRVYWPALAASLGSDGYLTSDTTDALSTAMGDFLHFAANAGATAITPGLTPAVVSTVKEQARVITQVRVGNRLDIQRRRADKQDETYSVAVVPQ